MDSRKILNKVPNVKSEKLKARISVSIDPDLLERFKKVLDNRPLSPVIEELVRELCDSADSAKRK